MIIELSADVTPVPQSRPRLGRRGAYEEPRVAAYKSILRAKARCAMKCRAPLEGIIEAQVCIRRNKKIDSRAFGDIDNHLKAVFDAMNGVCYADDAQIARVDVRKVQAAEEGVDIILRNEKKPSEDG